MVSNVGGALGTYRLRPPPPVEHRAGSTDPLGAFVASLRNVAPFVKETCKSGPLNPPAREHTRLCREGP